jgi:AraC family transcriptional regulator
MRTMASGAKNHTASQARRCVGTSSWHAELLPRTPYRAAYTAELPSIGFAFEAQGGVHAFGSDRRIGFRAKPNGLAYLPPGCDVYSQSDHGGEYLKVTFAWEQDGPWPRTRRFGDVIDAAAIDAAQKLRRELLAGERMDDLQCERLVDVLKQRTPCGLSGIAIEPAARSWMTPRRLKLIDDLIEARLDTKLTVEELAGALRLSTGFFCRAFRAAVGKAPHDYIIDRRVSRARALLQATALDLKAIAHTSGFASHAHMTATFRTRLGVTPGALRT